MREFYEPVLNLSDPEHHNTMGAFLTLKAPVDGEILRSAVEALRMRFPYFYIRGNYSAPPKNGAKKHAEISCSTKISSCG